MDRLSTQSTLRLSFVGATDDKPNAHPDYQLELKQFLQRVLAEHPRVGAALLTVDQGGADGDLVGQFLIPLAEANSLVVGGAALAWQQRQTGRHVWLQVGDMRTGLCTLADLDQLLEQAQRRLVVQKGGSQQSNF